MNISIMGDSISTYEGFIPEGHELYYTAEKRAINNLESVRDTWWMQVIEALDAQLLVNNSYSGSQVTGEEFPCASGIGRTSALGKTACGAPSNPDAAATISPDIILVYIGVNDFGFAVPCDRNYAESPEEPTFREAYATMLRRMQANYPNAHIVCGTVLKPRKAFDPTWSFDEKWSYLTPLDEFNERIRFGAAECGADVADLAAAAGGPAYDVEDDLHPNKQGHAQIAALWITELRRLGILAEKESM